ncbi:MAG: endo-1,4-beta-xylanase [Ruminococcus sp.]|nr:endo-1,4-beta-xylanase [Ruminococcus sp.]
MNFKKFTSAVTAILCCAGMMTVFPEVTRTSTTAKAVSNDFEVTYEGWYSNGETSEITAVDNIGFNGSRGMLVSNRKVSSDGAASSKGFYLWGGVKYNYSVQVYSETDETFRISLLCKDRDTEEETVVQLAEQTVKGGEWTEISAKYKAPENSYEYLVTITTDSTNDFVFDDFTVSTKEDTSVLEAEAAGNGLKDAYKGYGFRLGNILNGGTIRNDSILATYLKDFNAIECENETKPDATLDQSKTSGNNIGVRSNSFAAIADFCVKNNLGFRGHVLVWHSQTPEWFFKSNNNWVDKNTMDARLESYIKNMFNMYATQYPTLNLYAYDVVNEATSDDANRTKNYGGAREPGYGNGKSPWVQVYGDNSFIEKAFTYARQYAPSTCELYYNDYNEYWDHKRDSIINKILKPLSAKGLLDGMGMQSHVDAGANSFSGTNNYLNAMDMYLGLGINVQVTELEISPDNGQSENDQVTKYKAIFKHVQDVNTSGKYKGRVNLLQLWGPNDANTWISGDKKPLLYDKNNQPKAAYTALMQQGDGNGPFSDEDFGGGGGTIAPPEPNEYGWWYQCGFENGDDNWTNRGGNSVAVTDKEHYTEWGSHSLFVTDRTSAWMGASLALSSRIFKAGEPYSFSAHVKQNSGENVKFMMKIEYTDGSGETAYDEVANVTAPTGTWAQLVNTSYTIPKDASNIKIYVETEESLTDFYLDEAIGAVDGTGISGEGQPDVPGGSGGQTGGNTTASNLGDINADGVINAVDVALGRNRLIKGITDSAEKKAADVDRSGKYEINDLVLIQEYVLGKISEFPRSTVAVDTSAFEALFKTVNLKTSYKKDDEHNPLYTQRFGADPGWLVYDGRLYVYTTADAFEYKNGQMQENSYASGAINCLSTADLVNWTDHGQIPVARTNVKNPISGWANNAWAPDAAWKNINGKDKFFLYFANNGSGIGVITADDPTFQTNVKDPLGKELISRSTPNSNVTWLFDPGVYYDPDTKTGIIAYGGGVPSGQAAETKQGRIAKLGDDMISIVGTPIDPGTPYLFEDSSMIKIGQQWVYSFCHNWNVPGGANVNGHSFGNADIGYMTSTDPLGGYKYQGVVFKNTGSQRLDNGGNNHHSIIEFKGNYYVLYHSRQLEMRMGVNGGKGLNYRSPCIDKATVNGTSISCSGSQTGVSQIEDLNPYETVRAATMSNQSTDISINGVGSTTVSGKKGAWIRVSGANFKNGASTFTVKGQSGTIKVCAGGVNGSVIAYAELNGDEVTVPVVGEVSGKTDITIVFGTDTTIESWSFS